VFFFRTQFLYFPAKSPRFWLGNEKKSSIHFGKFPNFLFFSFTSQILLRHVFYWRHFTSQIWPLATLIFWSNLAGKISQNKWCPLRYGQKLGNIKWCPLRYCLIRQFPKSWNVVVRPQNLNLALGMWTEAEPWPQIINRRKYYHIRQYLKSAFKVFGKFLAYLKSAFYFGKFFLPKLTSKSASPAAKFD
jgi:hypothetical protein